MLKNLVFRAEFRSDRRTGLRWQRRILLCSANYVHGDAGLQQTGQSSSGQSSSGQSQEQPTETLKVNVNVVQLFFNVKDKHGALIPNLTKDDFDHR